MRHLYFIGRSTAGSLAPRVVKSWLALAGASAALRLVDLPLEASRSDYERVFAAFRSDPDFAGAQITGHKTGMYRERSFLDRISSEAAASREIGGIRVDGTTGGLVGFSPDMLALPDQLAELLGPDHAPRRDCLILGGGGAAAAIAMTLAKLGLVDSMNITESDPSRARAVDSWVRETPALVGTTVHDAYAADEVLARTRPGSLVVNATGVGKDAPGSVVSATSRFPRDAIAWDLNYRGELGFLRLADAQARAQHLRVADGLSYFVRNWWCFLTESLSLDADCVPFDQLLGIAEHARPNPEAATP